MLLLPRRMAQGIDTFIAADRIAERVRAMGSEISRDHPDGVHFVSVLKGAFMFLADLVRMMTCEVTLDFMTKILVACSDALLKSA